LQPIDLEFFGRNMKKIISFFLAVFAILSPLHSKIVEVQNFKEITSHLTPGTLVILDIDDTLLIPVQMLGCDEWFTHQYKKFINEGMSQKAALKKSLREWEAIRYVTHMELPEAKTDEIVRSMQDQGYVVMGLTTQTFTLCFITSHQLKENNINLSLSGPCKTDYYFNQGELGVLYRKGVLFTSGSPKGTALFTLCEKLAYKPKRILFINDKASHLKDIEEIAEKNNVEFIGLRYAYSDARKKAFRSDIADFQFSHTNLHKRLMSDKEAEEMLKKQSSQVEVQKQPIK